MRGENVSDVDMEWLMVWADAGERIFLMAQDAMIYLDELIAAYRASDIMRFDENRLRALQQLHDIREYAHRMTTSSANTEQSAPESEEIVNAEEEEPQEVAALGEKSVSQLIQDAKDISLRLIAYETDSPRQLAFAVSHLARVFERTLVWHPDVEER